MPLYVYGIMRARDAPQAAAGASEVDVVEHGEVSALVGELPDAELRLRRDSILAHADVLAAAFEHGPVLPMRLGTAMPDPQAVISELLMPQAGILAHRLDALDGKAELQVKATYAEQPLLRSILDDNATLRRSVERSRGIPAAAGHFEQIRIGEAIALAVETRRATDGNALLGALSPLAVAVSVAAPHHERAVLNASFLVDSGQLGRFDAAVEQLSEERSPQIEFKLIGPLPAYSFADGAWETLATAGTPA